MICIVCDKPASRSISREGYTEYYCRVCTPKDKEERAKKGRISQSQRQAMMNPTEEIDYRPSKIDKEPKEGIAKFRIKD